MCTRTFATGAFSQASEGASGVALCCSAALLPGRPALPMPVDARAPRHSSPTLSLAAALALSVALLVAMSSSSYASTPHFAADATSCTSECISAAESVSSGEWCDAEQASVCEDACTKCIADEDEKFEEKFFGTLPHLTDWPHAPVYVRLSPMTPGNMRLDGAAHFSSIPVNPGKAATPFETPLFKGKVIVRIDGIPGAEEYFDYKKGKGERMLMQCCVQGTFKRRVSFEDLYTGQAFYRNLTSLPSSWILSPGMALVRSISPGLKVDLKHPQPFMVSVWSPFKRCCNPRRLPLLPTLFCQSQLSPMAATTKILRAEREGEELDILSHNIEEDTSLLGGTFRSGMDPHARKKHFSKPENLKMHFFEPGVVYTFDFWQNMFSASTFQMDVGIWKVPLADYLNAQPCQIMAKDVTTGEFAWNVEIFHESLVKGMQLAFAAPVS